MRSVASPSLVEPFAGALLAFDLPCLGHDRRAAALRFVSQRIGVMPGPLRAATLATGGALRAAMVIVPGERLVAAAARTSLPVVGDYVRLVRSLAYAFIWETWPDTGADGSDAGAAR